MATGILVADTGGVTNSRVSRQPRLRLDRDSDQRLCQQVLQRDSWRCQRCGSTQDLQVHHIQLRSLPQRSSIGESAPKNPLNHYGESKLQIERILAWH